MTRRQRDNLRSRVTALACALMCAAFCLSACICAESAEDGEAQSLPQEASFDSAELKMEESGAEEEEAPPFTQEELERIAGTVWLEARGVPSKARQAAVVWCILNRLDDGSWGDTIAEVVVPGQFACSDSAPVTDELLSLTADVCRRWQLERQGQRDVGRTLPADYLFFEGDGRENYFRTAYENTGEVWDWSLPDPYGEGLSRDE